MVEIANTKKAECLHDEMAHNWDETAECPPKMNVAENTETAQERAASEMIKADFGMTRAKKDNAVAQEDKTEKPEAEIETVKA